MRAPRLAVPALLLIILSACATSGAGKSGQRRDRNVITRAEIEQSPEHNAYEVIRTLRPGMLNQRGNTSLANLDPGIVVFLDGQRFGDLSSLRGMEANTIEEIRYLSAGEAQARFGTGYPQGVILIKSRTR